MVAMAGFGLTPPTSSLRITNRTCQALDYAILIYSVLLFSDWCTGIPDNDAESL